MTTKDERFLEPSVKKFQDLGAQRDGCMILWGGGGEHCGALR